MAGYSCPECGHRMQHGETSPGRSRWQCPQCHFDASEATTARFAREIPDDPDRVDDMTKEEVVEATAYPPNRFTVEGERSVQHPEGLTSEGERPAHVTNRPLGGDPEMAVRLEGYAKDHGVEVVDSNIDALVAQVDFSRSKTQARKGRK